jgi:hypothetical protein
LAFGGSERSSRSRDSSISCIWSTSLFGTLQRRTKSSHPLARSETVGSRSESCATEATTWSRPTRSFATSRLAARSRRTSSGSPERGSVSRQSSNTAPRRRGIVGAEAGSQAAAAHKHAGFLDELDRGENVFRGQTGDFNFRQLRGGQAQGSVAARAVCREKPCCRVGERLDGRGSRADCCSGSFGESRGRVAACLEGIDCACRGLMSLSPQSTEALQHSSVAAS